MCGSYVYGLGLKIAKSGVVEVGRGAYVGIDLSSISVGIRGVQRACMAIIGGSGDGASDGGSKISRLGVNS